MFRTLREAVGVWCGLGLLGSVLGLLVYARLARVCGQMERLAGRFSAGRLSARIVRRDPGSMPGVGAADGVAAAGLAVPAARTWPCRFGWLVALCGYRAAGLSSQLRTVLEAPEMVALLTACPQAVRILRPVCRMLAIETSVLRPGVAKAGLIARKRIPGVDADRDGETCQDAPAKIRVRRPRAVVDFGRIPLPRGVLAAARRAGFGKLR